MWINGRVKEREKKTKPMIKNSIQNVRSMSHLIKEKAV